MTTPPDGAPTELNPLAAIIHDIDVKNGELRRAETAAPNDVADSITQFDDLSTSAP